MAIVKKYPSKVVDLKNPFPDIYIVSFRSMEKPFKYMPGQFMHLALDAYDPSSPWPESRCFSMQTNEQDECIKITYSAKGAFTGRMAKELNMGKEVTLKLPYGELFTKSHSLEKTVFIAGGTGVTPFLSLLTHDGFSRYAGPALYLGVRDPNYHIYRKELDQARAINGSFKAEIVFQNTDGMLNIEKIYSIHGPDSTYFVSGPPLMIKNFKKFLLEKGTAGDNIRTDDWE